MYKETANVMSEKAKYAQDEAALIDQKAMEAEKLVQQLQMDVMQSQQDRHELERQVGEAQKMASDMVDEAERLQRQAEQFRQEMLKAQSFEKLARDKLLAVGQSQFLPPEEFRQESPVYKTSPLYLQNRMVLDGQTISSEQLSLQLEREK